MGEAEVLSPSTSIPSIQALSSCLLNLDEPIAKRTRAVFYLRTLNTIEALKVLLTALANRSDTELMRHELAYVIGQMQLSEACDTLISIVSDTNDEGMVRHEAAEALGAIGHECALPVLEKFQHDPAPEVAETCVLAIDLIKYNNNRANTEGEHDRNPYFSVDPAPAMEKTVPTSVLKQTLLCSENSLFDRYRAMFSLRNRNDKDSALALAEAFVDKSALFRHEVAYVMGQMENPHTIPALKKVLTSPQEHRMVRHEAAEALGAIGTIECQEILKSYEKDSDQVVRESCEVALDIADYWSNSSSSNSTSA